MLKITTGDAHDRLQHLKRQEFSIGECCQNLINQRPFGSNAFYIFVHARTDDDGTTKRLIWQPRLTRPIPQSNSILFKAYPGTDIVKVIWMIPQRELWGQYEKGKVTENQLVSESIYDFIHHPDKLAQREEDDLSDEQIDLIYRDISLAKKWCMV